MNEGDSELANETTIAGMFRMSPENIDPAYIIDFGIHLLCLWHVSSRDGIAEGKVGYETN